MLKAKIVVILSLLLLVGCNDKEEKKLEEIEKNVTQTLKIKKEESPKEKDLLHNLGFDFKDDKIIIDINKTSNFFEQIESDMRMKAEEIESKIVNAEINITKDMGIKIEGNQIGIDLNKTQNMLQQINVLMKDVFLDINSSKY
jgi:hypothetical protein